MELLKILYETPEDNAAADALAQEKILRNRIKKDIKVSYNAFKEALMQSKNALGQFRYTPDHLMSFVVGTYIGHLTDYNDHNDFNPESGDDIKDQLKQNLKKNIKPKLFNYVEEFIENMEDNEFEVTVDVSMKKEQEFLEKLTNVLETIPEESLADDLLSAAFEDLVDSALMTKRNMQSAGLSVTEIIKHYNKAKIRNKH